MNTKGEPVRNFFDIETHTLYGRYKAIEALLPKIKGKGAAHPAEEGRFVESLLRDFLNKHLPSELKAMSGFILKPATKIGEDDLSRVDNESDSYSTQMDIIIYDVAKFPIYEKFEEFCIVPPEGVIGIISVKKTLRLSHIVTELQALKAGVSLCKFHGQRTPYSCLLGFSADFKKKTLEKNTEDIFEKMKLSYQNDDFDVLINEISVLDSFVLFKFRKHHSPSNSAKYVRINVATKMYVPLQRMIQSILGVYYNREKLDRPGYVSFEKGIFKDAPSLGLINYV